MDKVFKFLGIKTDEKQIYFILSAFTAFLVIMIIFTQMMHIETFLPLHDHEIVGWRGIVYYSITAGFLAVPFLIRFKMPKVLNYVSAFFATTFSILWIDISYFMLTQKLTSTVGLFGMTIKNVSPIVCLVISSLLLLLVTISVYSYFFDDKKKIRR